MYHTGRGSGVGFAAGVFTGAVMGAALGLLLAPRSGIALRKGIGRSVGSLRDAVAGRYRDLADRAGVELDNMQATVERATDAVEVTARQIVETAAHKTRKAAPLPHSHA
jgi:gas vesicle protein